MHDRDSEKERLKNLLKDSFDTLKQPNPLETLGLTQEAAKELGPEASLVAVKGLYRAWQSKLHPDKNPETTERQAARLRTIQSACDSFEEDPKTILDSYIRRKTPQKKSANTTQTAQSTKSVTRPLYTRIDALRGMIDQLRSPESINNVSTAKLLLKRKSQIPSDADSFLWFSFNNGVATMQEVRFMAPTGDGVPEPFSSFVEHDSPGEHRGVYFDGDRYTVTQSGILKPIAQLEAKQTGHKTMSEGWHVMYDIGDSASIHSFIKTSEVITCKAELVGCVDPGLIESRQRAIFSRLDERVAFDALQNPNPNDRKIQINPKRLDKRFTIEDGTFTSLMAGNLAEEGFVPSLALEPGRLLIANLEIQNIDKEKTHYSPTYLGVIEQGFVTYND